MPLPAPDPPLTCTSSHVHLQDQYKPSGQYKNAKSALCIHNIAFQVATQATRHCLASTTPACLRIACTLAELVCRTMPHTTPHDNEARTP